MAALDDRLVELQIRPVGVEGTEYVPLSSAEIESIESQYGVGLPLDYRNFVDKYGVSQFHANVHCLPADPNGWQFTIDVFFGGVAAGRIGDTYSVILKSSVYSQRIPTSMIPIGSSNHNLICLGMTGADRGKVYL